MQTGNKAIVIICILSLFGTISTTQAANKSVYAITNHSNSTISSFKIINNELKYQTETQLGMPEGSGAVGLAIDPDSWTIFVSYDGSKNIGVIDARLMKPEEDPVVIAPWELAGIVWDNTVDRLYGIRREGSTSLDNIVIYKWNSYLKELSQDGDTIKLPSFPNNGLGITLDENEGLLYATDNTNTVYVYDTSDWSFIDSFNVTVDSTDRKCVAIDVYNDGAGNSWIYTGGYSHTYGDHNYLVKTSTNNPYSSSEVDVGQRVSGITFDSEKCLVYITSFDEYNYIDQDIKIYDSNLVLQYADGNNVDGHPADICLEDNVSYKPPEIFLDKVDVNAPNSVVPGDYITYEITYGPNGIDHNNVIITDYLPVETDFVFGTQGELGFPPDYPLANYDPDKHIVTWEVNDLNANDPNEVLELVVQVNELAEPNGTITNYCDIESDCAYNNTEVNTPVACWSPDIIYVDVNAFGNNLGTSWTHAYPDLQVALETARDCGCDEIWAAAGTYYTHTDTDSSYYSVSFELLDGVGLYGGFAGYETERSQRNWILNETILEGNLPDGSSTSDTHHIVEAVDVDASTVLDGFIIQNAQYAGIKIDDASPVIKNTVAKDTVGTGISDRYCGSGVYITGSSSATLENCEVIDNGSHGVYAEEGDVLTISDCNISENGIDETDLYGGGIYNNSTSLILNNTLIYGNKASNGGGLYNEDGTLVNISKCIFSGNIAGVYYGGIYNYMINSSSTIKSCLFSSNQSESTGGGLGNDNSSPSIINCTFTENISLYGDGGAIDNYYYSDPTITNCILWGDSPFEIHNDASSSPTVTYSCIQGSPVYPGQDNTNSDPNFRENDEYYHLSPDSTACIDAGDPSYDPNETDIDGEERVIDGDDDGTATVDMGADEYYWSKADFDVNEIVNFIDYAMLANAWMTEYGDPNYNETCDLSDNDTIDNNDLELFCEDWLWQAGWAKQRTFGVSQPETMELGKMSQDYFTETATAQAAEKQLEPKELTEEDVEEIKLWLEDLLEQWQNDPAFQQDVEEDALLDLIDSVTDWLEKQL